MIEKNYLETLSDKEFKEKYNASLDTFFKNYPNDGAIPNLNQRLSLYQTEYLSRENKRFNNFTRWTSLIALIIALIGIFK